MRWKLFSEQGDASLSGLGNVQFSIIRSEAVRLLESLSATQSPGDTVGGQLLLNAGIAGLVPWGWKGTSRKIVAGVQRSAKVAAREQASRRVDSLVSQARGMAASYSVRDQSLRSGANSQKLTRRFGTSLDHGSPVSRLRLLIGALDSVSTLDLVPNQEVPRILEARKFERVKSQATRLAPELHDLVSSAQNPQDPAYYQGRVSPFGVTPQIAEALAGALARLQEGGPDAFRQGAGSLRVALEGLLVELSGTPDWHVALNNLVTSDEERGIMVRFHRLLSRSAHAGHVTSKEELQLFLDLYGTIGGRLVQLRGTTQKSGS